MATADGTFSLKQWREVHDFFAKGNVPFTSIEPSALDYDSVQKGRYKQTLNTEKSSLKNIMTSKRQICTAIANHH